MKRLTIVVCWILIAGVVAAGGLMFSALLVIAGASLAETIQAFAPVVGVLTIVHLYRRRVDDRPLVSDVASE